MLLPYKVLKKRESIRTPAILGISEIPHRILSELIIVIPHYINIIPH